MYGLSAKKSGCCGKVAVGGGLTVHCKLPLLQALANEDTDLRTLQCLLYRELTAWKYPPPPLSGRYMYLKARLMITNVIYLLYSILPILDSFQMKLLHYQDSLKLLSC